MILNQPQQSITSWPSRILSSEEAPLFTANFNRLPFQLSHNLGHHPMFEVPRLIELSEFLARGERPDSVTVFTDDARVTQGWERSNPLAARAAECLADIQHSRSWVLLKDIQKHPDYRPLLDQFIVELEEMTRQRLRDSITWIDAYLFIASPNMITPYHIDHESNFLFQIHGQKTMHLFDPNDRTILTNEEIEAYYVESFSAAKFRDDVQPKAMAFQMKPGVGVHHPPLAPHWVRNGSEYSVSLSLLFFLREFDLRAKVYQVNHYLRRFGVRPTPPGQSRLKDRIKQVVMSDLAHRPKEKKEVVRFGLNKYRLPYAMAKNVGRRLLRNGSAAMHRGQ